MYNMKKINEDYMKKFNLFKEIIIVKKEAFLEAINRAKLFGISIDGTILYEPFSQKDIFIYQGKYTPPIGNPLMPKAAPALESMLGANYQIVIDDERVLIKAFSNWQELIAINTPRASYDDTTGDGVAEFADRELEAIGWHATEFDISYRSLVELLEQKCEGLLLCIEQEEPYQFSGLGYLADDKQAQKILFEFCQNRISKLLSEDAAYALENLNDDEREAASFFKLL